MRAPGWSKSCLVAAERGSGRSPDTGGMQRGPSKAAGLQRPPSYLRVSLWKSYWLSPPLQPRRQPAPVGGGVSQVVAICLMSFSCSSRKRLSRKSRVGVCAARAQGCRSTRAWLRFFSRAVAASLLSRVLPHSSWDGFCAPGRGHSRFAGFASSRDAGRPCPSPWRTHKRSGPRPPEPHPRGRNRSPEGGRCRRAQMQVDPCG